MKKILKLALILCALSVASTPIFARENTSTIKADQEVTTEAEVVNGLQRIQGRAHQFVVTADVLNVRSNPTTSARIIGKLYRGDVVWMCPEHYTDEKNDDYYWMCVYKSGGGLEGWVATDFVENISR